MKATYRLFLALAVLTIPATARAVKVPIPIEGASLNISFQLQTQALFNQHGTPDGQTPSFDMIFSLSRHRRRLAIVVGKRISARKC